MEREFSQYNGKIFSAGLTPSNDGLLWRECPRPVSNPYKGYKNAMPTHNYFSSDNIKQKTGIISAYRAAQLPLSAAKKPGTENDTDRLHDLTAWPAVPFEIYPVTASILNQIV
ncbi:hypothetical protein [Megasphaera sp. DJF_B143]|uniref:hypothetical protein n=1 Tax=Megasphaera sp. DJF_B143 TaxID=537288 RepID=UPI001356C725|nr:hypothetical protein [Megasphaera sp. DJF_B143]